MSFENISLPVIELADDQDVSAIVANINNYEIRVKGPNTSLCQDLTENIQDGCINLDRGIPTSLLSASGDIGIQPEPHRYLPDNTVFEPDIPMSSTGLLSASGEIGIQLEPHHYLPDNTVFEPDIPMSVNGNETEEIVTPPVKKSKPKKSKVKKDKKEPKIVTEPKNSWIQFCIFKKNQAILQTGNPEATCNQKEASDEWNNMSKTEKAPFVELGRLEKVSLGGNYRAGRSKKSSSKAKQNSGNSKPVESNTKIEKKKSKNTVDKDSNQKKDSVSKNKELHPSIAAVNFIELLEKLDEEIDKETDLNIELVQNVSNGNTQLAVSESDVRQLNSELSKTQDKYNSLSSLHAKCKD